MQDLQRDLKDVLGVVSPVTAKIDPARPGIVVEESNEVGGREAHAVFVRGSHAVLQGADVRGTIYAVC